MNFQQSFSKDFYENLCLTIEGSDENARIRENYQRIVFFFKPSLKIPQELPKTQEIFNFFSSIQNEMNNPFKTTVGLKSFFIKTKVFLVWLISAYEFFNHKPLEFFVKNTKLS